MNRRAKRLGKVISALKDSELAELGRLARERQRLEDEHHALRRQQRKIWEGTAENLVAQAATRKAWARWAAAKEIEINQQIARLAARIEDQKHKARTAIGRAESFGRLLEKERVRRKRSMNS